MRGRGGLATTISLVIAAIFGLSYVPRKAADAMPAAESQKSAAKSNLVNVKSQTTAGKDKPLASCEQIAKRLERFYRPEEAVPMAASCFPPTSKAGQIARAEKKTNPNLQFTIAIAPNPIQTHLPLLFDRVIEAVQQAAEDSGYVYDSSWFPWNLTTKSSQSSSEEKQATEVEEESQEQPGVMVFRRAIRKNSQEQPYDSALVIFVVAEQPSGGISDVQIQHALEWMNPPVGAPSLNILRIIGPTFSGSLPSLARALEIWAFRSFPTGIVIFSGFSNLDTSIEWFQSSLRKQDSFRTFYESDSLMTDRFLCYLQHEGYDLNRVAILSEEQTAFGAAAVKRSVTQTKQNSRGENAAGQSVRCGDAFGAGDQQPIYLYYPRDIASLRSAYEKQSIFNLGRQQNNAPSTTLRSDLAEKAGTERDTVRTYGGQLTPLAQEAVLLEIAHILESRHIEFVILRSSNSLDQLFLTEFLRHSYRSAHVVIDGADLLFRSGMDGASMRGVMLLSPYPLLDWTQDAIPAIHGGRNADHKVFPQDLSEGLYIASRKLFEQLPNANTDVPIFDYGAPKSARTASNSDADRRPATWVSVVGNRQFWALAALNENTEIDTISGAEFGPHGQSLLLAEDAGGSGQLRAHLTLPGEMSALLLGCIGFSAWHLYCCSNGSIIRRPRPRAYFAPIPRAQHTILIFLGSLLLGLLGITLGFVLWLGVPYLQVRGLITAIIVVAFVFFFAFLSCRKNYQLPIVSGGNNIGVSYIVTRWRKLCLWAVLPTLAMLAIGRYLYLSHYVPSANRFPVFWRSVYLRSTVSPLLPQILLLVGFYAWFWVNLHGLALFGDDRPVLPTVDDLPQMTVAADKGEKERGEHTRLVTVFRTFSREDAGHKTEYQALPLGRKYLKDLLISYPCVVAGMYIALDDYSLRNLGDRRFGYLIFVAVSLCIAMIVADTFQLSNTWSQLRQFLIYIDRLRLRRTFGTLKGLYDGSLGKFSGNVLEERYRLISRQFESMRNLQNALAVWSVISPEEMQHKQIALEQLAQCERQGSYFAIWWHVVLLDDDFRDRQKEHDIRPLTEFQQMLAATAGCIMKHVLLPAWSTETQPPAANPESSAKSADGAATSVDLPSHVRAAEEFFILPYLGFIQNILGRMRTIAFGILWVFVAAALALSSYPFDPVPVIGGIFLTLFLLVGVAILFIYTGIHRDPVLSRIAISKTEPGKIDLEFWKKLFAFALGPLIALLTTLFPSIADFLASLLEPAAQLAK